MSSGGSPARTRGPDGVAPAGTDTVAEEIAVELDDVAFVYPNGTRAMDAFSLRVPRGRSLGVVGPSGCGKSTLLGLLAGLYPPTSGQVVVRRFDQSRHPVSMVFQSDTLLPWLTVADNVGLHFKFRRGRRSEVADLVHRLIEMAGLTGFEKAYPYQLSGGMRRRVAFLAGVAAQPELLLLDEPFSSLDEPTRVAIHQDVFRIVREFDMAMVLVTHDLAEAISLCDEIVILTARPAAVRTWRTVPFGEDRNMLGLRQRSEFLDLYATLWQDLSAEIAASSSQGGR